MGVRERSVVLQLDDAYVLKDTMSYYFQERKGRMQENEKLSFLIIFFRNFFWWKIPGSAHQNSWLQGIASMS